MLDKDRYLTRLIQSIRRLIIRGTMQPAVEIQGWALNMVHNSDALVGLGRVPSNSLDVAITSPPYWGQRGSNGLGSEPDPREYIKNLTAILAETMRCLKSSGTLWLNIGDSYNTPINWREEDYVHSSLGKDGNGLDPNNSAYTKNRGRRRAFVQKDVGWLQYGNLLGIPYRVVLALTDLGFLFRGEVIWEKSRPLPEGVCRRPHRRHEGIYIIAKDERHSFRVKPPVGSVWKLLQTPNMTEHCSTFPLDLPKQCIQAAAVTGQGIIFDPFMGSGTTGRAARLLGHQYLGFEIDSGNCRLANEYIEGDPEPTLPLF
ncbi:MAG: DNA-methyltransferase [Pyrinomonadaceae bacterium]